MDRSPAVAAGSSEAGQAVFQASDSGADQNPRYLLQVRVTHRAIYSRCASHTAQQFIDAGLGAGFCVNIFDDNCAVQAVFSVR